jgi:hypothetical protein
MYRLYNPNTGEHFYTESYNEAHSLAQNGWNYEGLGWTAASSGAPVYRVYNPNAKGGDHYYTKSLGEAQALITLGWKWDNGGKPVFYSGGATVVYVAYNPNAQSGAHNYTTNNSEQNHLLSLGWKYGAIAWNSDAAITPPQTMDTTQIAKGDFSSIQGVWYSQSLDDTIVVSGNSIKCYMNGGYVGGFYNPTDRELSIFANGTTLSGQGALLPTSIYNFTHEGSALELNDDSHDSAMADISVCFYPKGVVDSVEYTVTSNNGTWSVEADQSNLDKDRIFTGVGQFIRE